MRHHVTALLLLLILASPAALAHAQTITPTAAPDPLTVSSTSLTESQRAAVIAQLQQLIIQ